MHGSRLQIPLLSAWHFHSPFDDDTMSLYLVYTSFDTMSICKTKFSQSFHIMINRKVPYHQNRGGTILCCLYNRFTLNEIQKALGTIIIKICAYNRLIFVIFFVRFSDRSARTHDNVKTGGGHSYL